MTTSHQSIGDRFSHVAMSSVQQCASGLAVLTCLAFGGCLGSASNGRVEVSGKITVDGVPVEQGTIALVPLGSGTSAGGTISAGDYSIPAALGPLPGKYRVEIKAVRKTGEKIVNAMRPAPDNLVDKIEQFLPPRYNSSSELNVEIQPSDNRNVNFDLTLK